MARYSDHLESWGNFADIKVNAAELLEKEIIKRQPKSVMLSSVTDPYNPLERKYKLTRQILEILLKHQIPTTVLTKSDLVVRDIDLLSQFDDCKVGFSFISHDHYHIKNFEIFSAVPIRRLRALSRLKNTGITTYAFIAPILPYITDIEELYIRLKEVNIDFVLADRLNNRDRAHNKVQDTIKQKYPWLTKTYNHIFNVPNDFWSKKAKYIQEIGNKYSIETSILFK